MFRDQFQLSSNEVDGLREICIFLAFDLKILVLARANSWKDPLQSIWICEPYSSLIQILHLSFARKYPLKCDTFLNQLLKQSINSILSNELTSTFTSLKQKENSKSKNFAFTIHFYLSDQKTFSYFANKKQIIYAKHYRHTFSAT